MQLSVNELNTLETALMVYQYCLEEYYGDVAGSREEHRAAGALLDRIVEARDRGE